VTALCPLLMANLLGSSKTFWLGEEKGERKEEEKRKVASQKHLIP